MARTPAEIVKRLQESAHRLKTVREHAEAIKIASSLPEVEPVSPLSTSPVPSPVLQGKA